MRRQWCGGVGSWRRRRAEGIGLQLRSHVLQVDSTGLADDREMEQKKGQLQATEREKET